MSRPKPDPMKALAAWVRAGKVPRDATVRFHGSRPPRCPQAYWIVDMHDNGLCVANHVGATLTAAARRALTTAADREAGR